jgi:hypothetical protein
MTLGKLDCKARGARKGEGYEGPRGGGGAKGRP